MRGWAQRIVVGVVGTILLGVLSAESCEQPASTCEGACAHAVSVCPSVDRVTCVDICGRVGQAYMAKLATSGGCPDVKAADPGAPAATQAPSTAHGR